MFILKVYTSVLEVGLNLNSIQNANWVALNFLTISCILHLGSISDLSCVSSRWEFTVGFHVISKFMLG